MLCGEMTCRIFIKIFAFAATLKYEDVEKYLIVSVKRHSITIQFLP